MKNLISFIINIAVCYFIGFVGSFFTASDIKTWYVYLKKPFFNPPSYIFAPIWIILYTLIGISFYLFYKKDNLQNKIVYFVYVFHLFLNCIWSILFFRYHYILISFLDIVLMILTLLFLINIFYNKSKTSFYLMLIYLAWLLFACILNLSIFLLN